VQAEVPELVGAHLDLEGSAPVSVGASSAVQVDVDVFQAAGQPVDAAVEQSIGDGVGRCRAARQVLVGQDGDPLRILIHHGTIVGCRRWAFLGLSGRRAAVIANAGPGSRHFDDIRLG